MAYGESGVTITNDEDKPWDGCNLNLNTKYKPAGTWRFEPKTDSVFAWGDFTTGDGTRFNIFATKPQSLVISCGARMVSFSF
jgi:hypothetical protein